jgi:RNA polymerase sigma factor (sigma-70 family)
MTLPPFQALLDEHASDVHRFLVRAVGPGDAMDCFQETFLSALRAYPRLRDTSNLRGWLFTIAHRKTVDHYRSRGRRPLPVESVPEAPAATSDDVRDGEELWSAVRDLPPKQRSAVVYRHVVGLPYAEIGRIVGCSEDAARQNVRQALARLRTKGEMLR